MTRQSKFRRCFGGLYILLVFFSGWWFPSSNLFAEKYILPGPGDILEAHALIAPSSQEDAAYLGLAPGEKFYPAELGDKLIILEIMNVYCASCQYMRPNMNELFAKIKMDPQLRDTVTLIAIGAGNDKWDIGAESSKYDFPMIPDEDYEFHQLVGQPPTPFLLFTRPYGENRLVVMNSHLGRVRDMDVLFQMVKEAYAVEMSSLTIKPFRRSTDITIGTDGLVVPISETQLKEKVRQSLTVNGIQAQGIDKIALPPWGIVYMGVQPPSNRRIFARVVARKIPCGDCHDVFYIYSFDTDGNFINFIPIAIYKYGNRPWNEADIAKIQQRFNGRSLTGEVPFQADVDAVSSATISTALIFDSIGQTQAVLRELGRKGYLP